MSGEPSNTHWYLFNGDFVDRGSFSVECIVILLIWKIIYPNTFHLNRGNHETKSMNSIYGYIEIYIYINIYIYIYVGSEGKF